MRQHRQTTLPRYLFPTSSENDDSVFVDVNLGARFEFGGKTRVFWNVKDAFDSDRPKRAGFDVTLGDNRPNRFE